MRAIYRSLTLALAAALLLSAPALAQGRRGGPMMGQNNLGLLMFPGVQEELKLSDDQNKKAQDALMEIRQKYQGEFQGLRDLSDDERTEKMRDLGQKLNEDSNKYIKEILDKDQTARLEQISLQVRGIDALAEEDVQKKLEIKDDQKEKIQEMTTDLQEQSRTAFQDAQGDFRSAIEKIQKMRKEALDKVLASLTEDQKKKWDEMTGKPFELRFEGPPGGGR